MSAKNLTESTVNMLIQHIQSNIGPALAELRVERSDAKVTTEPPPNSSYFIYEQAVVYRPPAVFVIADSLDMMKSAGPNSIMALLKIRVSVVVEDVKMDNLTIKAWRYQDALFQVLDQAQLISTDESIKLIVIVQSATYSPAFTQDTDKRSERNTFRKEVVLECDVRHFEQP